MLSKNVLRSLSSPRLEPVERDGYTFRGFKAADLPAVQTIYSEDDGSVFPRFNRLLLRTCGSRMCLVATLGGQVIGFDQFYFNDRDIKENTIHEGYVAVAKAHSGKGVASIMRRISAAHFRRAGFDGISTRISRDNHGSMKSAAKVGFRSVEDYTDPDTGDARSYLVLDLTNP
jgi:RimJ/RimL family protein N-acetyltransferase